MPNFKYSIRHDGNVFRTGEVILGTHRLDVSAITVRGSLDGVTYYENEDAFHLGATRRRLVGAVFDGVTTVVPPDWLHRRTGARYASHTCKALIARKGAADNPPDLLRLLNAALLESSVVRGADPADVLALPATTAVVVILEADQQVLKISEVSDSFCVAYYADGTSKLLTSGQTDSDELLLSKLTEVARSQQISLAEARQTQEVLDFIQGHRLARHNRPDGTGQGVLNGDPYAELYCRYREVPLAGISSLLIGTDGFVPPDLTVLTPEGRAELLRIIEFGGVRAVINRKRAAELSDRERIKYPRSKFSDDGTGIHWRFLPSPLT